MEFFLLMSRRSYSDSVSDYFRLVESGGFDANVKMTRLRHDATVYQSSDLAHVAAEGLRSLGYDFKPVPYNEIFD